MLNCCKEWIVLLVFIISGTLHPMILFWLAEGGAIDPLSLTYILPSYIGMTIAGVVLYQLKHDLGDEENLGSAGEFIQYASHAATVMPYKLLILLSICGGLRLNFMMQSCQKNEA